MQKETREEVVKKYELSDDEIKEISKVVFADLTKGKTPSENPVGIIVAGQPGSGKTGVAKYAHRIFSDAIMVDIDDFRFYHPKIKEILDNYPEHFAATTNKFISKVSGFVSDMLFESKYSVVIHKTFKNIIVLDDTLEPMKKEGYTVHLIAHAVNGVVSKLSACERTQEERKKFGYNRVISNQFHDDAYNNLTNIVVEAKKRGLADSVEVFMRGAVEDEPVVVYMETPEGVSSSAVLDDYYGKPVTSISDAIKIARIVDFEKSQLGLSKRINEVRVNAKFEDEKKLIGILMTEFYEQGVFYQPPTEVKLDTRGDEKTGIVKFPSNF